MGTEKLRDTGGLAEEGRDATCLRDMTMNPNPVRPLSSLLLTYPWKLTKEDSDEVSACYKGKSYEKRNLCSKILKMNMKLD